MYSSEETNNRISWAQYLLTVFVGLVPLSLSATLRTSGMIGQSTSVMLMVVAGIIFSGLGLYSSVKDTHKGFGMVSLTVGAVLLGLSQLPLIAH